MTKPIKAKAGNSEPTNLDSKDKKLEVSPYMRETRYSGFNISTLCLKRANLNTRIFPTSLKKDLNFMGMDFWTRIILGAVVAATMLYVMWK